MKKFKIGNKFIVADSIVKAIKIAKIFDSTKDNAEIDYLTKEEEQAVEDYRKAIAGTTNPKLLELYKHILDEELEHIRELEQANNNVEDSVKDERLSPMTYKKLKELGVRPEQWKKWSQEEANEYIKNKSGKNAETSEKKTEETNNQSDGNEDVIKELSTLTKTKPYKYANGEIEFEVSPKKFKSYDNFMHFFDKLGFKRFGSMELRSGTNYIFTREVNGKTSAIHVYTPEKEYDFDRKIVKNTSPIIFKVNYQMQENDSYWYK